MKNICLLILLLACLAACDSSTNKPAEPIRTFSADEVLEEDTVATIKFETFTLVISPFEIYDDEHLLDKIQHSDTVIAWGAVGAVLGEAMIRVIGDAQIEDLRIEQRYETTLGLSSEESGCYLYDWKHYYSPWQALRQVENGMFKCIEYTIAEQQKFPAVSTAELKAAVKKYCDAAWWDQVKDPHVYPCEVGLSTWFLRVSGKTGGKSFTKYIEIDSPMNC